jgi:hypothetical protein
MGSLLAAEQRQQDAAVARAGDPIVWAVRSTLMVLVRTDGESVHDRKRQVLGEAR